MILFHGTCRRLRGLKIFYGEQPNTVGVWLTESRELAHKFAETGSRRMHVPCYIAVIDAQVGRPKVYPTYAEFIEDWSQNYQHHAAKMRTSLLRQKYDSILIERSETDWPIVRRDWALLRPKNARVVELQPFAP